MKEVFLSTLALICGTIVLVSLFSYMTSCSIEEEKSLNAAKTACIEKGQSVIAKAGRLWSCEK